MLSIIISSYQTNFFTALEKNIAETCGIEYEIIKIDNPGKMGICQAYNMGAAQAQYDNLLFIHEDILFETENWGKILLNLLQKNNVGCIGVAGADYIPNTPCPWWAVINHYYSHINHYNIQEKEKHEYTFNNENLEKPVKFIDGVFVACKKEVWNKFKFDERLTSFHAYDISFSLNLNYNNYQNIISNLITITHFSPGNLSLDWLYSLTQVREQNPNFFNQQIFDKHTELFAFKYYADQLRHLQKRNAKNDYKKLFSYISLPKFGWINMLKAFKKMAYLYTH